MANYKGINQKGLAFHAEAKQKYYKEEKKIRSRLCLLLQNTIQNAPSSSH